jgi:hypothetical protein
MMSVYATDEDDEVKAESWKLPSVPAALKKELDDYTGACVTAKHTASVFSETCVLYGSLSHFSAQSPA